MCKRYIISLLYKYNKNVLHYSVLTFSGKSVLGTTHQSEKAIALRNLPHKGKVCSVFPLNLVSLSMIQYWINMALKAAIFRQKKILFDKRCLQSVFDA